MENKDGITQCRAVYYYYKVALKEDNKVRICQVRTIQGHLQGN